jgi:phospho-N-acetylmuramoyl-pentapeptide-transferase
MGGMIFPFILLLVISLAGNLTPEIWAFIIVTAISGFIGFIDDWIKVAKKRSMGFKAREKMACQILLAAGFSLWLYFKGETLILVPFAGEINLGVWRIVLDILAFTATVNAVNFTDGLDGLASGTVSVSALTFGIMAFMAGSVDLTVCSIALMGICMGFLWVNVYPARLFMGDTGSLTLGGAIAAIAMMLKLELLIIVVGGIFVAEMLSVIIQVISFKTTGKRVFKMSPIHHHFEKLGYHETTITLRFCLVSVLLAIGGFNLFLTTGVIAK